MSTRKLAIVIDGPCRDYDYAVFCHHHVNAAEDFASQWICDLVDNLEDGENGDVKVSCRKWRDGEDECHECESDGVVATDHVCAPATPPPATGDAAGRGGEQT